MPGTDIVRVHGNAFSSEQLLWNTALDGTGWAINFATIDLGMPQGWGRTFHQSGWYHVALPSLSQVDGAERFLDGIVVEYQRSARMAFDEIHVWDGSHRLWTGSSAHPTTLRFQPWRPGSRPSVKAGIGLSLRFTNSGDGTEFVTFHAAAMSLTSVP
jgi:hypothetical protein